MAYKNKLVSTSGRLQLIQSTKKSGSRKFLIKLNYTWTSKLSEISELFDPEQTRRLAGGFMWKFNTRKEAEELMAIAILKGYSK